MDINLLLTVSYFIYTGSLATVIHDPRCQYRNGSLDCTNRELQSIDCHFPMDVSTIDLSFNKIVKIPWRCFKGLRYAQYLSLCVNDIRYIDRDAFYGLENLLSLQLYDNYFEDLPIGIFTPLISLRTLLIEYNRYQYNTLSFRRVMQELAPLNKLESLNTDVSMKLNHSNWCPLSHSLRNLKLTQSSGITITADIFNDMSNLKVLEIDSVSGIEKNSFEPLFNLTSLKISVSDENPNVDSVFKSFSAFRGRIMDILSVSGNNYLRNFHINKNHFSHIQHICLKQLILKSLFISYVEPRSFEVFAHTSRCLEVLDMSYNPIATSQNTWILYLSAFPQLKVFRASYFRKANYIGSTKYLQSGIVHYHSIKFSIPNTLEEFHIRHTYSRYDIPGSLIVLNGDRLRVLDLGYIRFMACNGTIHGLSNVQTFDMSGWNCSILNEMLLSYFPKLQTFIARESFLGNAFNININSFKLFERNLYLRYIDMSANAILRLPNGLFGAYLNHLQLLNLSNNLLHDFPVLSSQMSKLKVIDLRSNELTTIPRTMRDILDTILPNHLYLGGNPFQCTCESMEFLSWLNTTNLFKSIDIQYMKCITETKSWIRLSTVVKDFETFTKRCESKTWIVIAATLCSIVLTVLILTIVYIRYKNFIEYIYIRIKIRLWKYKQLEENEYEFQAFVSHSHLDTEWVLDLYRNLTNRGVDICLDAKDFIAGNSVAENIVEAINKSRKVVFVITKNFLESTWGSYELEMTRMHAFREDRDNMIVVILKDDIPLHKMPKVLRDIWYKILCIKWHSEPTNEFETEDVFYSRLYEAVSL